VLRYHEDKVDPFIGSYWKGASKLGMGVAHLKYEYANAFPKKGKKKK
jgi:hypothetical protein